MKSGDATERAIVALVREVGKLGKRAAIEYQPVVDQIQRSRCTDANHIERTLDGLLDFCDHESVLQLYKSLCRYYWAIDPNGTAFYVRAYRERWETDTPDERP